MIGWLGARWQLVCWRALGGLLVLWLAALPAGCTDVRPTIKIGVLAPFEGLHRRSGYATLAAVRAAIADFSYGEAGILPLALDDGAQPQQAFRSAQKLLADARVAAVVGPLSPVVAHAVEPALAGASLPFFQPYRIAGAEWAAGLVRTAARLAQVQGAAELVLAGWTPGWPALDVQQWSATVDFPVRLDDDPARVGADAAVFWLGSPEAGADYLQQLRQVQPGALFVLGPEGEDAVFAERFLAGGGSLDRVYWTVWTDAGYTDWTIAHSMQSPNAYLAYRATAAALQAVTTQNSSTLPASWDVQLYRFDRQGSWFPVDDDRRT